MPDYQVNPEELRNHAKNLESLATAFQPVEDASKFIAQDDEAYGQLCGWIAGILEGRHAEQDRLVAYVAETLRISAAALQRNADRYGDTDDGLAQHFARFRPEAA